MSPTPTPSAPRPTGQRPAAPASGGGLNVTIDPRKLLLQYWPWLAASFIVGIVLSIGTYYTLLKTYPLYDGDVWFEFSSPLTAADQEETMVSREFGEAEIERFIGTQLQIMRSENTLMEVVTTRPVREDTRWIQQFTRHGQVDRVEAAKELEKITRANLLPESNIVRLRVRTTNARDAAVLANAVREIYLTNLRNTNRIASSEMLEALNRRRNAMQDERRILEDRKQRLFTTGLETLDDRFNFFAQQIDSLLPVLINTQYGLDLSRERLERWEEQLQNPSGPTYPEEVRSSVDQHPIILELKRRISGLEAARMSAQENFGANHRQVREIERQIRGNYAQLEVERQRQLTNAFEQQIELLRNTIRSYETTEAETLASLDEARRSLAEVNRLREDYMRLDSDAKQLAEEARALQARIDERQAINERAGSSRVKLLAAARVLERPSFPQLVVVIPAVTLLTVSLVAGLILLREILEQRVRSPSDVQFIPRIRVLGLIPDISEDPSRPPSIEHAVKERPTGVIAECVRQIRTEMIKQIGRRDHTTLLVISGLPETGGTTVITNIAESFAAIERRVLIIDGNLRRPRMHEIMGVPESPGLSEVLSGSLSLDEVIQRTETPNLNVLTAGSVDAQGYERLTTEIMGKALAEAREKYDIVLIDVAPAIVSSDAIMLASRCDATMLVVRAFSEKRGLVARIRTQLEETKAEFLGVVVNGVRASAGGYFRRNFRATHEYSNNGVLDPNGRGVDRSRRLGLDAEETAKEAYAHRNGEAEGNGKPGKSE